MAKSLPAQKQVECMLASFPILRLLKQLDHKMYYQQFAKEIGLMGHAEKWRYETAGHVATILYTVQAVDRQANGGNKTLETNRIVSAQTDLPGKGEGKVARIVISDE